MSIVKNGNLERIRVFAYAQISSYIQRYSVGSTVKELSADTGINYNTLIGLKNMRLKSISLQKLTNVMERLDIDYSIKYVNKSGKQTVEMEIDRSVYNQRTEEILHRSSMEQLLSKQ